MSIHKGEHTFIETWNCESSFSAVRLVYAHAAGGDRFGVGAASVAAVDRPFEPGAPPPKVGFDQTFVAVTFNGAGKSGRYEQQKIFPDGDKALSLEFPPLVGVPESESVWTPRPVLSDWINLSSVNRSTGKRGSYLRIKTLVRNDQRLTGPLTKPRHGNDPSDPCPATGLVYQKFFVPGNHVLPDREVQQGELGRETSGYGAVYAVQFVTRHPGITVQAVGDSILQGIGYNLGPYTGGYMSFAQLACSYLSTSKCPVTFLQSSLGDETSENFFNSARADLDYADVGISLIQTWSGNDIKKHSTAAQAQAAAEAAWQRAMDYAELVRKQGGIPVFLSAVPQAPKMGSKEAEEARRASAKQCRKLAKSGELVLDLDEILGDNAPITNYKPAFMWVDNIHPNTAAHYVLADKLAALISTILPR